ncbi:MAG: lysophospholipase [Chitinophagaceae bacterium]|nr:lysophospholipase [Chitinophagaceae bacterium]
MIKNALLILMAALAFCNVKAQNAAGDWKGILHVGNVQLAIEFHFQKNDAGVLTGTWDSPDQGAFGLPFSQIRVTQDSLIADIETINGNYTGKFSGKDSISGVWMQGGSKLPLNFTRKRADNTDVADRGEDISIQVRDSVEIKGSGWFHDRKAPLVVIIAGSGPTDRDGNNRLGVFSNSYLMLGKKLDSAGISSFRYDKRGVARSIMRNFNQQDLTIQEYINDVVDIVNWFHQRGYSNIWLAGHSEGSLLGMVAAQEAHVKGFISIAGAGFPAGEILRKQLNGSLPSLEGETERILSSLEKGQLVADVPDSLKGIFISSIQPYLISWLKYDPVKELEKLNCPVLIVQGTCDSQVDSTNAIALSKGNKKATLKLIRNMTHVLKDGGNNCADELKTYSDQAMALIPELAEDIIGFIRSN